MTSPAKSTGKGSVIWIAGVALVVIVGVIAVIAARGSRNEATEKVAQKQTAPVEVTGAPALPALAETGADPAVGETIPSVTGSDFDGEEVAIGPEDGKAKVMETLLCTGRSGQKSTTESIEEFIYPTEYEPASFADEGKKQEPGKTETADAGKREALGPTPTAFETRNLGSTVEIVPTVSDDGKTIDLRLVPEIVYHVENEIWAEWKDEHGSAHVQMPVMYTLRLNTVVKLANGKPLLVGALTPKNDKGAPDRDRKLMVFVKADVLPE